MTSPVVIRTTPSREGYPPDRACSTFFILPWGKIVFYAILFIPIHALLAKGDVYVFPAPVRA